MAEEGGFRRMVPVFIQVAIATVLLSVAYRHVSETKYSFPTVNTLERRMAFCFRCLALSVFPVIVMIFYIGSRRGSSAAFNPLTGNNQVIEFPVRILQNTLEQFVIHGAILMALSTTLNAETVKFIPFLAGLFVVGRLVFLLGYKIHPTMRALGFGLTYGPTVFGFFHLVSIFVKNGIAEF